MTCDTLALIITESGRNGLVFIAEIIKLYAVLSLTFREESRLRLFENRAIKRIFGPNRDEVTGKWRKLHTEELNDLYSSPNIFMVIK
jgi:hypothetical protein